MWLVSTFGCNSCDYWANSLKIRKCTFCHFLANNWQISSPEMSFFRFSAIHDSFFRWFLWSKVKVIQYGEGQGLKLVICSILHIKFSQTKSCLQAGNWKNCPWRVINYALNIVNSCSNPCDFWLYLCKSIGCACDYWGNSLKMHTLPFLS